MLEKIKRTVTPMMKFMIACAQFQPRLGEVDYNLSQIEAWSEHAAKEGVSVIVFPKLV